MRRAIAGVILVMVASAAHALTPMAGRFVSQTDTFPLRVQPINLHTKGMKMEVKVFDHSSKSVRALI